MNKKDMVIKIASRIYDRNPKSYKALREVWRSNGLKKVKAMVKAIMILPLNFVYNSKANKEIKSIKQNGSIFEVGGVKFYLPDINLRNGDMVQNKIYLEQNYFEIHHLKVAAPYIKGCVLDIGANIGNHTCFFLVECAAKKVYAFEPVLRTYQILQKNVALNHLQDRAICRNIALGAHSGQAAITHQDSVDSGGTKVEASAGGGICMDALDNLDIEEKIDFIKIDVEGYEYEVLKGGQKTICKNKPIIFVEIGAPNRKRVNRLLKSFGYICIKQLEYDYIYSFADKSE
ncbi:MAG: FkbM family methyltransferase [Lachnospiraceae bacterium]|nr:FkbM family methyltransferase [Lachnospiraceae bacterium]